MTADLSRVGCHSLSGCFGLRGNISESVSLSHGSSVDLSVCSGFGVGFGIYFSRCLCDRICRGLCCISCYDGSGCDWRRCDPITTLLITQSFEEQSSYVAVVVPAVVVTVNVATVAVTVAVAVFVLVFGAIGKFLEQ